VNIPVERQRLGGLSKQGNPLLRFLWGEAGAHAARQDPELQRFYRRKLVQKGLGKASVAQTENPAVDHVAGSDRVPRVLSVRFKIASCLNGFLSARTVKSTSSTLNQR
jgi:hypothetical protein